MFILWPINDQPTSKTQKLVFAVFVVICFVLAFTNFITFTL